MRTSQNTIPINGIYSGWRMEDAWLDN